MNSKLIKVFSKHESRSRPNHKKLGVSKVAGGVLVVLLCVLNGYIIYHTTGISFHNFESALQTGTALLDSFNITKVTASNNKTKDTTAINITQVTPANDTKQVTTTNDITQVITANNVTQVTTANNVTEVTTANNVTQVTTANNVTQVTTANNVTQVTTANNITQVTEDDTVTLEDIYFSVITTIDDENEKLPVILKTWFQLASNETWIFTDAIRKDENNSTDNKYLSIFNSMFHLANGHVVMTNCSDIDERKRLCCIVSTEYRLFTKSSKKWFCSFEDDHYVNVPRLVKVLQKYNYKRDWYIGREAGKMKQTEEVTRPKKLWYHVFDAGICITGTLINKLYPIFVDGPFTNVCENEKYPVDDTIANVLFNLNGNVSIQLAFHSRYDLMKLIPEEDIGDQISLSYDKDNVLNVSGFNESSDPTRFLSLHCLLFPSFKFCPSK